jgi:metal-dependent amidase/aminoacylase/carboxypeptidase family protein
MALDDALSSDAAELALELAELRHRLHRHPEIGLQLPWTQQALLAELDGLGLEISTGEALTSVTAVLRASRPAERTVLLRADMDALPVTEASRVEFPSEIDGAMHACGHDLHMAMLVGAARLLAAQRDELPGDVVFMFQPGEEGYDGAGKMIAEGVLHAAGRRVDAAYGMHVTSGKYPPGVFCARPGTLMAASDWLEVTVRGQGTDSRARVRAQAPALCRRIGAAYGVDVDVTYHEEYPLTLNDAAHTAFAAVTAADVFGEGSYQLMAYPEAGAEDFSRVLAAVPGCYLMLGAATRPDYQAAPSNHSPRATFSDSVLPQGALLHAQLAIRSLAREAAVPA